MNRTPRQTRLEFQRAPETVPTGVSKKLFLVVVKREPRAANRPGTFIDLFTNPACEVKAHRHASTMRSEERGQ